MVRGSPQPGPTRRQLAAFGGWLVAAGVYVGIGLVTLDFLLSFWVALAYVLVAAWLVPAAIRRGHLLRKRSGGTRGA